MATAYERGKADGLDEAWNAIQVISPGDYGKRPEFHYTSWALAFADALAAVDQLRQESDSLAKEN